MPHEVVVSRRQEFRAAMPRLLGDGVRPTYTNEWSLDRTFGGEPLTVLLDVLELAAPFQVEQLPRLPHYLPTLLVIGFREDDSALLAMAGEGIPVLVEQWLQSGCLAQAACPTRLPFDLFVRWGRVAAEIVHALLAQRCGTSALTPRETEVARLAEHGRSNGEIADVLVIGIKTVKNHLTHSYDKLGIRSRHELMARATARRSYDRDGRD